MATQNPIEQEGTYPLPEAQVDRFMLMVKVGYPTREEERKIMDRMTALEPGEGRGRGHARRSCSTRAKVIEQIYVDDKIKDYIVDVVFATREPDEAGLKDLAPLIEFGASPARVDRAQPGRARARVPAPPRLRDARGREGRGARRAAPPAGPDLRGRGRGGRRPSRSSGASSRSSRFRRRSDEHE